MGTDGYETIRPLNNAVGDAIAMRDALEALDFEVFLETDRDLRRMRRALEDFAYDAEGADVALVFYAGHGVEIGGVNRLLPTDTDASSLEALEASTLPLEDIRETLAQLAPIGLVILDACRNDPFGTAASADGRGAASLSAADLPASVRPGLGRMGRSENVLYAFSAAPGATASDGDGDNSPFTSALTKYLGTDGLEIRSVLTLVQQEVYDRTRGHQLPYVESGLPQTFFAAQQGELPERERLLLAMADVTPDMRDEIERIAAEHDMPLAPLYGALVGSELAALSVADRRTKLTEAAVAFSQTRKRLQLLSSSDPKVMQLRADAQKSLSLGAFEEAGSFLERAIAIDDESRRTIGDAFVDRTLSQAASLQARAGVARTSLDHETAIAALEDAAELHRQIAALDVSDSARSERNLLLMELGSLYRLVGDTSAALDAFERMRAAAVARLEAVPGTAEAERDFAASHNEIARVLRVRGNLVGALMAYEEAFAATKRLAAAYPDSPVAQHNLALARSSIGDVLADQGDLTGALATYRESLAISERLAATHPDDVRWQVNLSERQNLVGSVLLDLGDANGALRVLRDALSILERLVMANPGDDELQAELAENQSRMGRALAARGESAEALGSYRASLAIRERLALGDPGNTRRQRALATSQSRIGDVLAMQGNLVVALDHYNASLAIAESLFTRDPDNAVWKNDMSIGMAKIGDIEAARGNFAAALDAYRTALANQEQIAAADPRNAEWQRVLAAVQGKVGNVLRAQGDDKGAVAAYRASLSVRERLAAADATHAGLQRSLSAAHVSVGDMLRQLGDRQGALKSYEASLAIHQKLLADDPENAARQRDLLISYYKIAKAGGEPRRHFQAALDIAERMEEADRLAPADSQIPLVLRQELEALGTASD